MQPPAVLLALQECDLEIHRIGKSLDELPEKRAILETRHKAEEVRALHAKTDELCSRLDRSIAANNDEVSQVTAKIAEVQATLDSGSVKNPKEVHNLSREMDALRRRIDKIENDTLTLMEKLEKARAQADKVDSALDQLEEREKTLISRYQEKGGELQRTRESCRSRREELATSLAAELLGRYETLRESKAGVGAARLDDTQCTACRVELPIERVSELRSGPDIAACPSCRRLLVVRGTDESE